MGLNKIFQFHFPPESKNQIREQESKRIAVVSRQSLAGGMVQQHGFVLF